MISSFSHQKIESQEDARDKHDDFGEWFAHSDSYYRIWNCCYVSQLLTNILISDYSSSNENAIIITDRLSTQSLRRTIDHHLKVRFVSSFNSHLNLLFALI